MNIIDFQKSWHKKVFALLLVIAFVALPVNGAMAGNSTKKSDLSDQEGPQFDTTPKVKVKIEKKLLEVVITNVGKRFTLSEGTIITGLDGQQVSIRKMLVPCDAQITYTTKNGVRVAERITMIRVDRDSSWKWAHEKPE